MPQQLVPLVWRKPVSAAHVAVGLGVQVESEFGVGPAPGASKTRMAEYLESTGIPSSANPKATPKQTAIELLQRASAVEHAFAIQYLYAAYSLQSGDPSAAWALTLRQIAREEMGHLATVQNLLMMLGQRPYLGRQSYPAPADYEFERELAPFGLGWLGDFVLAESPFGAALPQLQHLNSGLARVGAIYAHLAWIFQPTDEAVGPWGLTPADGLPSGEHLETTDFMAPGSVNGTLFLPNDWGVGAGAAIRVLAGGPFADVDAMRHGALAALHDVSAQGEGMQPQDNSHFERLLPMYNAAAKMPGPLPVKPVVPNPHTVPQATGDAGLITDPTALKLAELLNLRYRVMLTLIEHGAITDRSVKEGVESLKNVLAGKWARDEMHAIHALCDDLNLRPLKNGGTEAGSIASGAFELPDTFLVTDAERWAFYRDAIQQFAKATEQLSAAFPNLVPKRQLDSMRLPIIESHIAGLGNKPPPT